MVHNSNDSYENKDTCDIEIESIMGYNLTYSFSNDFYMNLLLISPSIHFH